MDDDGEVLRARSYGDLLALSNPAQPLVAWLRPVTNSDRRQLESAAGRGQPLRLWVGDPGNSGFDQWRPGVEYVQFEIDLIKGTVRALSSHVGLPPVYIYRHAAVEGLASPYPPNMHLPLDLGGVDTEAAADVLRWGHPIDHRTLARNLALAPPGCNIVLRSDGLKVLPPVDLPKSDLPSTASTADIIDCQIAAFRRAAATADTRDAFVSLSGGLDSRATLVALHEAGHHPEVVTLSPAVLSLDAELASTVCNRLGHRHTVVQLGHEFREALIPLLGLSAALTLGTAAFAQSVDAWMYQSVDSKSGRRITGNLGNQVGRGGVEGLSFASEIPPVFSPEVTAAFNKRPNECWFIPRMNSIGFGEVLLRQEVNYWSTANYALGSYFTLQQTPYADEELIGLTLALLERLPEFRHADRDAMRLRDLRHRLRGTPRDLSFQRQLLARSGVEIQDIPINWGWRAAGGWSLPWVARSSLAALDAAAAKIAGRADRWSVLGRIVPRALRRPMSLVDWPTVLTTTLSDYSRDLIRQDAIKYCGLFEPAALERLIDDHISERRNAHAPVVRILELALGCAAITNYDWRATASR